MKCDNKATAAPYNSERARQVMLQSLQIHFSVYTVVNVILAIINYQYTPAVYWFFYPLLGWGVLVGEHYLACVRWPNHKEMAFDAKLFEAHLVPFLLISFMLITSNVLHNADRWWSFYPVAGWAVILFLQRFVWFRR